MNSEYLTRLHRSSGRLHAARDLRELLDILGEEARLLIGAHQAVVSLSGEEPSAQEIQSVSLSHKYAAWRDYDEAPAEGGIYLVPLEERRIMRLTQAELVSHPRWRGFGRAKDRHPPMRGFLAAPIIGSSGQLFGLVQLSDKLEGDFDDADANVLEQLSRTAALAIQNVRLLEAAQAAEAKLRRFIDSSNDLICTVRADATFEEVSSNSREILGYEAEELVGRRYTEFVHPDDLERTGSEADNVLHGKATRSFANRYIRKDGSIAHLHWSSVWSLTDKLYYCVVRDMTERVQLEQQFAAAQRMDAIGKLTGGMAHDFNNLLTIILGSAEALAESSRLDEEERSLAALAQEAALRGAELTSRLLAFARRQPLAPSVVDVEQLLTGMLPLLRRTIGEHLEIRLQLEPPIFSLIDPAQLESAILNLCLNARDACAVAGAITISAARSSLDGTYAGGRLDVPAGDYVRVSVADDGAGMQPETLQRAFEPFFTTKEVGEGTGLGLSMVYGFVKQSGGHVKLYSEVGHGTVVKMYLPATSGIPRQSDGKRLHHARADRPARILVVEDDTLVRTHVSGQLRSLGYDVSVSSNGVEALAEVEGGAEIDLLFTDLVMPGGLNGRQLAELARRHNPKIRILFTSGYADVSMATGLDAKLLNKPYRKSDLAQMVAEALGN